MHLAFIPFAIIHSSIAVVFDAMTMLLTIRPLALVFVLNLALLTFVNHLSEAMCKAIFELASIDALVRFVDGATSAVELIFAPDAFVAVSIGSYLLPTTVTLAVFIHLAFVIRAICKSMHSMEYSPSRIFSRPRTVLIGRHFGQFLNTLIDCEVVHAANNPG